MMPYVNEKAQACAGHVESMRKIHAAAQAENRTELNAEEQQKFDQHESEANRLRSELTAEREQRERGAAIIGYDDFLRQSAQAPLQPDNVAAGDARSDDPRMSEEYRAAYQNYVRRGKDALTGDELRALSIGADSQGGFIVPTLQVNELFAKLRDEVFVRQFARVLPPVPIGAKLGVPTMESEVDDSDWTVELSAGTEDSGMGFGGRELEPHPLRKRVKASADFLASAPNAEQWIRDSLMYKFGVSEEKGFLLGTGSRQPLGVFVASDQGVSTDRDVSTGNTSTAPTFDGLKNARYSMKQGYVRGARWAFHRDVVKALALITDGDGRYLWSDSVRDAEEPRLDDIPVDISEFAPNTMTSGLYVGILANWSYYMIADSQMFGVLRANELYAESNQVGLFGTKRTDGMPIFEDAFARVKLA